MGRHNMKGKRLFSLFMALFLALSGAVPMGGLRANAAEITDQFEQRADGSYDRGEVLYEEAVEIDASEYLNETAVPEESNGEAASTDEDEVVFDSYTPSDPSTRKSATYYHEPTQAEIIAKWKEYGLSEKEAKGSGTADGFSVEPNSNDGGRLNDATLARALKYLNFVRFVAGVADDVELSEDYISKTQKGSYLNWLNESLSHFPTKPSGVSDEFYEAGYKGAGSSNIGAASYNRVLPETIIYGWVWDADQSNISKVGHRMHALKPDLLNSGFGYVPKGSRKWSINSMYVDYWARKDSRASSGFGADYITWPAKNMPYEIYGDVVSYPFSVMINPSVYQTVSLDDLRVTLTSSMQEKSVTLTKESNTPVYNGGLYLGVSNSSGYSAMLKDTIIFNAGGSFANYDSVHIKIEGLRKLNGSDATIEYDVNFFSAESPKKAATSVTISQAKNIKTIKEGESIEFTAQVQPSDADRNLTWNARWTDEDNRGTVLITKSSDPGKVTVKGIDRGTLEIYAVANVGGVKSNYYALTITEGKTYDFVMDDHKFTTKQGKNSTYLYNNVVVRDRDTGNVLKHNTDYLMTLTWGAGENYVTAKIQGRGNYYGRYAQKEYYFDDENPDVPDNPGIILILRPKDVEVSRGEPLPADYEYTITRQDNNKDAKDALTGKPSFTTDAADASVPGVYKLTASGASVKDGYSVKYEQANLYVPYKITFDITKSILPKEVLDTAKAPEPAYASTINGKALVPTPRVSAKGYICVGWYRDAALTESWNLAADEVNSDMTLYAKFKEFSSESEEDEEDSGNPVRPEVKALTIELPDDFDYTYDGTAKKPLLIVKDGDTLLLEKRDYTLSYKNNKEAWLADKGYNAAKQPVVIVTGKGNYSGKEQVVFEIDPIDISETTADAQTMVQGAGKIPVPEISIEGKKLKAGKDFDYITEDVKTGTPGEYKALVKGKGNYTGEVSCQVFVADKNIAPMSKVTVTRLANRDYTGDEITLDEKDYTVTYKGEPVDSSKYTVSYVNNTLPGKAYMVLTGDGINFTGSKRVLFTINGENIAKAASLTPIESVIYTGMPVKPEVALSAGGQKLTEGVDYTVVYSANINPGKASVVIKGMGKYYGSVMKSAFTIKPFDITGSDTAIVVNGGESYPHTSGGSMPPVAVRVNVNEAVRTLHEGTDFTVSYSNNKGIGTGTATVKGKGLYAGSRTVNFEIVKRDLSTVLLSVPSVKAGTDVSKIKPVLLDINGKKLSAGKDYDTVYEIEDASGNKMKPGDKIQAETDLIITVTAKGDNYTGMAMKIFRAGLTDISKAKATLKQGTVVTYSGSELKLGRNDLSIVLGGKTLEADDYTISSAFYKKNIFRGTASITIYGKNAFCGYKTFTFKIDPRKLKAE